MQMILENRNCMWNVLKPKNISKVFELFYVIATQSSDNMPKGRVDVRLPHKNAENSCTFLSRMPSPRIQLSINIVAY